MLACFIGVVLLAQSGMGKPARQAAIVDLGTLAGRANSWATAVNNAGQVVCLSSNFGDDPVRSFLWTSGAAREIGAYPADFVVWGTAINSGGVVSGFAYGSNQQANPSRAFLWRAGVLTELTQALGSGFSEATDVNNRGDVAGNAPDGFVLSRGHLVQLGTLLPDGSFTVAAAINNKGQAAGTADSSGVINGDYHAIFWQSGTLTDIDKRPGIRSNAYAIDDHGRMVGKWALTPYGSPSHAFIWQKGVMSELPRLSGDSEAEANSINNRGQVVGESWTDGSIRAVTWVGGRVTDLNTLLPSGSGWALTIASAINDRGQIAGSGYHNGYLRPYLLTP
jgi:probable HAF family extracellular repeat protein